MALSQSLTRPLSPAESTASALLSPERSTMRTTKPGLPSATGQRLPREGAVRGGGKTRVHDNVLLATLMVDLDVDLPGPLAHLETPHRPSAHGGHGKKGGKKGSDGGTRDLGASLNAGQSAGVSTSDSPRSSTNMPGKQGKDKPRLSPEERKRMEIFSKWEKTEGIREKDQKEIVEHIDKMHDHRDARYKRLIEAITGRDNLAYKTAIALRERETHAEERRRDLYAAWDEKVFQPIATQAFEHLNPANRALEQKRSGKKGVNFDLPHDVFRLVANVHNDPARKPVVDNARENAFHKAATNVLRNSQSEPTMPINAVRRGHTGVIPCAVSRPVLEPTEWGQVNIQGSMFGHFAQVAEHGVGFHRGRRGGHDAFVPNDDDGVLPCGTRHCRINGYSDVGILRGEIATAGETSSNKTLHGMSCAAPNQDHFTFDCSRNSVDLEFPLGKKIFPEMH